jgi:hypothetical protein
MRAALLATALMSAVASVSPAPAQSSGLELQAGVGYARAFNGGGVSFAAAVEHPLSTSAKKIQHALGGSLWYSEMSVGSAPGSSIQRHLVGLGVRYQLELRARHARPFLAVPLQVLRSDIEDRATLQPGSLLVVGIPETGPPTPVEDEVGSDWGWGTGLEIGVRIGLSEQLSAQTSVQGLYQRIYESGTRNGAWLIHGGITYQPGRSSR